MAYITKHGGVNMHPTIEAENHPLFRAYLDFWKYLNGKQLPDAREFLQLTNWKKGWYQANIPQEGDHFSRDNMWGVYFLHALHNIPMDGLPVWKWNGQCRWHPNQWMFFQAMKSKQEKPDKKVPHHYALLAMMDYSYRKYEKNEDYTTGPCLWTLAKYFLWDELPTVVDVEAFKYYCSFGYRWKLTDQPIVLEIEEWES